MQLIFRIWARDFMRELPPDKDMWVVFLFPFWNEKWFMLQLNLDKGVFKPSYIIWGDGYFQHTLSALTLESEEGFVTPMVPRQRPWHGLAHNNSTMSLRTSTLYTFTQWLIPSLAPTVPLGALYEFPVPFLGIHVPVLLIGNGTWNSPWACPWMLDPFCPDIKLPTCLGIYISPGWPLANDFLACTSKSMCELVWNTNSLVSRGDRLRSNFYFWAVLQIKQSWDFMCWLTYSSPMPYFSSWGQFLSMPFGHELPPQGLLLRYVVCFKQ